MSFLLRFAALLITASLFLSSSVPRCAADEVRGVACGVLHSLERLDPADRAAAESLLLRLLDSEALYTVVGGLKPASDGFWQTSFAATVETTAEIEQVRRILRAIDDSGTLTGGVLIFERVHEGKRTASAFVVHRGRLSETIARHRSFFATIGIAPETTPQAVFERIDRAASGARWRGFGLIFGYPEHAVEFFVAAGAEQERTGEFVEREFRSIPTFAGERRFVYAVPVGHVDRPEDERLRILAGSILDAYRLERGRRIDSATDRGAIALWTSLVAHDVVIEPGRCEELRQSCRRREARCGRFVRRRGAEIVRQFR